MTLACAVAVLACAAGHARAGRVSVLDLPSTARSLALATTGTADADDPTNVALNPALAALSSGVRYTAVYADWSGDDYFANSLAVGRGTGTVCGGIAVTHRRLDFKTYNPASGYYPNPNQSSYMTGAAAVAWRGGFGAIAVGASIAWDTSEHGDGPTLGGAGVRAAAPTLSRGRLRVDAAMAWSALDVGGNDGRVDPNPASNFTPLASGERRRAGATLRAAFARADADEAELVSVTLSADAIGDCGAGGAIDASAAGVDVTVARALSLRAGYGDAVIGARDAVTLGTQVGRAFGAFTCRVEYTRVDTRDGVVASNAFGAHLSYDF